MPITLPPLATTQMLSMLNEWQRVLHKEDSFVSRIHGVSCLWARFDGVWNNERKQFQPFEIQGGCGWLGYAAIANPVFKKTRDEMMQTSWPHVSLVIHESVRAHDDVLWLKQVSLADVLDGDLVVQVRPTSIRRLTRLYGTASSTMLERHSVTSLRRHFSKSYGIRLGWWKPVDSSNIEELPWEHSFVLKPKRGMGSKDILAWTHARRSGRSTRTQILKALAHHEVMLLQNFIDPDEVSIAGQMYNVIHRPFFGYDTNEKKWKPMHGVWTARPSPNIRIHGASDAISGPLFLE